MSEIDKSIFWDINKSWSYGALFNFIVGNRGSGKTYGAKDKGIENFIRDGSQFMYVRRYKEELRKVGKFFDDIRDSYKEHELKVDGKKFQIDGKDAGYAQPLSTAKAEKSVPYPNIGLIIVDEFIIDKGNYHYLQDEVIMFLELYETVARMRDVRVYFLSNAITTTNPYFMYFDLQLPRNKKNIIRKGDILLELVQSDKFIAAKQQTRFGQLIKGTSYGDYAINNKFLRDDSTFLEKKSGSARHLFAFKYQDTLYGVWIDYSLGKLWVSLDVDPCCKIVYSLTLDDHSPNTLLIKRLNTAVLFKMFIDAYKRGNVWFENIKVKNVCYQVIKLTY